MKRLALGMFLFIWAITSNFAFAVTINSNILNDFEDGSTHGWKKGAGASPKQLPIVIQETNGNHYLEVNSIGGDSASSQMAFINETEWRGNYNSAGVGSIQARMKNMGDIPLYMRAGFTTRAIEEWHFAASKEPIELPADGQWYDLSFAINEEYITPFLGNEGECCFPEWDFDAVVGGVNQLKFISAKDAHFWNSEKIVSTMGVDDIRVSPEALQSISLSGNIVGDVATVPVPATAWLFMTGLLGVAGISKNQNTKQAD